MSYTYAHAPRTGSKFFPVQRVAIVPRERIYSARDPFTLVPWAFPFPELTVVYGPRSDDDLAPIDILQDVAERHGITVAILVGNSHSRALTIPRREAALRMHNKGMSTPQIGKVMNRDHTSVLNMLGKLNRDRGKTKISAERGDKPSMSAR